MVTDFKKNTKKNTAKKLLFHTGGILVIGLLVFLVVANIRVYKKRQEFLAQVADLQKQIQDIEKRNADLKQGLTKSDDPDYIEKVAREELDLQKPGEQAVSFIMPEPQAQVTATVSQNNIQGWFAKMWNWIRGKR